MGLTFDIKFITTKHDIKVGYVVAKKYCVVASIDHGCVSTELMTEDDIDETIDTFLAELEELRTAAKEKLKE